MSADEQDTRAEGPTQEPGGAAPAPSAPDEARSPDEIRADIDATRGELGDTVEALAAKTDVKGRAQQRVEEAKQTVAGKREEIAAKARATTPEDAQHAGQQVLTKVKANPLPAAIVVAAAAGFLLGRGRSR